MNYLIIFNFVVNMAILGYFIYKKPLFYIEANRTFWCKKIYSFTLMMYTHRGEFSHSSKGIFTIPIRNYRKTEEWDRKMFDTGQYKKYNK